MLRDVFIRFIDRGSPGQVTAAGLALVTLVGIVDYLTGFEISTLAIYYLLPALFVTWQTKRWLGFLFCGVSIVVWLIADYAEGHPYSHSLIPAVLDTGIRLGSFLILSYLLSELKSLLKSRQVLATTDDMTGVLNAREFKDVSRRLFELASRYHHPTVLAYIDIDDFKVVNDTLGHSEGDRVLHAVASTLSRHVRATDVVGRLGGDEFAVLLPETDYAGAENLFNRIHEVLVQVRIDADWSVSVSIGVALFPRAPSSIDEALKIADRLMYRVKKDGKNCVLYEEQPAIGKDSEQPVVVCPPPRHS